MSDSFGKLVIRSHAPRRRAIALGAIAVVALAVFYGMFELGRYDAGYRVLDSVRDALSAGSRVRQLEADNSRLRTQLEAADVARRVDREGYRQIEHSLGDMQSQIARLNQDLSFYRGLVQPEAAVGVKVQRLQIVAEPAPGEFRLIFVLMQSGKSDAAISGNASINIDGMQRGKPATFNFAQVSPKARNALSYSFRYFQDFDERVRLPPQFEPSRVGVDIHSRDGNRSYRQAFVWKTQGVTVETDAKGGVNVQAETE
jgi:hypothetical protein